MDDSELVSGLAASFESQLSWYGELKTLVESALSKIVLSRGDLSQVMSLLKRKQELAETIALERERIKGHVAQWQDRKGTIGETDQVRRLDAILDETQAVIKGYLQGEQQMKKYLRHLVDRSGGSSL